MIDFGKLLLEHTNENIKLYEAAHKEGYRLGFADGIAEAKKIVEKTLGPLLKPADESHEPGGNWV